MSLGGGDARGDGAVSRRTWIAATALATLTLATTIDGHETVRALSRWPLATGVLVGVAASCLAVIVGRAIVGRRLEHRFRRLERAARAIADGDLDAKIDADGADGLGAVADALEATRRYARELHRSNGELERFACVAAHDLRTPLRTMEHLAEWTIEDAGEELSDTCRENLERLLGRARRLGRLQDDLLVYACAGRADDARAPVDLVGLCAELRELLDPERRFAVEVVAAPAIVEVAATPLRRILMNLLANAMRHHDRDRGRIRIGFRSCPERMTVSVDDDGPGILPEHHDRVFGPFERLESPEPVEGSGLGLSLVRELVERHGGTVRLDSDPARARGSTFTFELDLRRREPIGSRSR